MFQKGDLVTLKSNQTLSGSLEFGKAYEIKEANAFGSNLIKLDGFMSWYYPDHFQLVKKDTVVIWEHDGHTVIVNSAGGKDFKYCRNCKVEV